MKEQALKSILLIEDDDLVRDMLTQILTDEHFNVRYAADGSEALAFLEEYQPDLVITDLIMPEKNGLAVMRTIGRKYPKLKIIAISGGGREGPENYLKNALLEGASYVFTKPIERKVLLDAINDLLKSDAS